MVLSSSHTLAGMYRKPIPELAKGTSVMIVKVLTMVVAARMISGVVTE